MVQILIRYMEEGSKRDAYAGAVHECRNGQTQDNVRVGPHSPDTWQPNVDRNGFHRQLHFRHRAIMQEPAYR